MGIKLEKKDFLKRWNAKKKIEEMESHELSMYIEMAMNVKMSAIMPIPYEGKIDQTVSYDYPELTAKCPMTGIQDLYRIQILFIPNKSIPELKSLKFYFLDYVDIPISHEHLLAKIFRDFKCSIQPKYLKIILDVAIRGGIHTIITYEEPREKEDLNSVIKRLEKIEDAFILGGK